MPGRVAQPANRYYRYSINGQEKTPEISPNTTAAPYWEYDARIAKRWNKDPRPNHSLSPYSSFQGNPIFHSDPLGDTTYPTPSGEKIYTSDPNVEVFDGGSHRVGEKIVNPAKGTLRSFTVTSENVQNGKARFVAKFNLETGEFKGYGWDQDLGYLYTDLLKDFRETIIENDDNRNNPLWDPNISSSEAKKNLINNSLGLVLPTVLIRPVTIAANVEKFTVDPSKFNFFFGRVVTGPQANIARSAQNLKDLTQMGITTEEKLMQVFTEAMKSGTTISTKVTEYGTNVMKSVNVGSKGKIEVGFFYQGGNMTTKPTVTTIIPKIF